MRINENVQEIIPFGDIPFTMLENQMYSERAIVLNSSRDLSLKCSMK